MCSICAVWTPFQELIQEICRSKPKFAAALIYQTAQSSNHTLCSDKENTLCTTKKHHIISNQKTSGSVPATHSSSNKRSRRSEPPTDEASLAVVARILQLLINIFGDELGGVAVFPSCLEFTHGLFFVLRELRRRNLAVEYLAAKRDGCDRLSRRQGSLQIQHRLIETLDHHGQLGDVVRGAERLHDLLNLRVGGLNAGAPLVPQHL